MIQRLLRRVTGVGGYADQRLLSPTAAATASSILAASTDAAATRRPPPSRRMAYGRILCLRMFNPLHRRDDSIQNELFRWELAGVCCAGVIFFFESRSKMLVLRLRTCIACTCNFLDVQDQMSNQVTPKRNAPGKSEAA
eukprot:CAMPEP_0178639672 /NCGR_PEP_ID=MMETSP0698-20121128/15589_1 /TAXON_ID=265572 /ORGANISM="Extubocellulus spinifer, Strain CCMP396" /LENGTH=138 /DNA_ID=CAMNT_0020280023 /DNA_START=67 /DNA_END=480 /DNA_ORIENTATION=-